MGKTIGIWVMSAVCMLAASPATAQSRAHAEPVRVVTYQYRCACTWRGYCDAEQTLFKTVTFDKSPDYQRGCTAESSDAKWLRVHANTACKADGFDLYYSAQSATCGWEVDPKTEWILPQRQRPWMWVYRKRILRHRRARAARAARLKAQAEARLEVDESPQK